MTVGICIVGFNNINDISRCISMLERSSIHDFRIIICENGSRSSAQNLIDILPPVLNRGQTVSVICSTSNSGYAGGINQCLAASRDCDYWWMLNPDTMPDEFALERMMRCLLESDADAVGCVLLDFDGRIASAGGGWHPRLGRPVSLGLGVQVDDLLRYPMKDRLRFISGASMVFSRKFLETTGLMREDYFLYCEELEWCLRGRARGMRLAIAFDSYVYHQRGSTTGSGGRHADKSWLSIYLDERNKLNVVRDTSPENLSSAIPISLLLLLIRYSRRFAWKQLGWALSGWWAGVSNKRGMPADLRVNTPISSELPG
jgi:N-acetylglucosaminyl-diphospho-decaprenol L-rhamnosyltransferase